MIVRDIIDWNHAEKKYGDKFWYPWSTGIKVGFFIAVKVFPTLSLVHTYISRFEHVFWDINTEYKILALENEIFCYLSKQSSFSSELNIHDREQPCTWSYLAYRRGKIKATEPYFNHF